MKVPRELFTLLSLFSVLIVLAHSVPSTAQTTPEISGEEFKKKIIAALGAENEEKLVDLVEQNRENIYSLVHALLDSSIGEELQGNDTGAEKHLRNAQALSVYFTDIFNEDYLMNLIHLYGGWSIDEKKKKIEADSLMESGMKARGQGDLQAAINTFSSALEFYQSMNDRRGQGYASNNIGIILFYMGQYQQATENFQNSLNTFKEIGDRKGQGKALNGMGAIYYGTGEYQKALKYYEQALNIFQETGDQRGEGKVLNNVGIICYNLGQYRKALVYQEQALTLRRKNGNKAGEAITLNSIAGIFNSLGQSDKAIEYNEQALSVFREIGDRVGEATSLNNMGDIYIGLAQYEKAVPFLQESLTIHRDIGDRKGEEISLNSLGFVYRNVGQHETAIDHLERSFTICQEIGDGRGEAYNLIDLGAVYFDMGLYDRAVEKCQNGLNIALSIEAPEIIWPAQMRLGMALEREGAVDEALDHYVQSVNTIEAMREQLGIESLQTHFFKDKISVYDYLVNLYVRQGRYEEAFNVTERAKARALLDLLSLGRLDVTAGISSELMHKRRDVELRLHEIQQRLSSEYSKPKSQQDIDSISSLEDDLANLRSEHQEILRTIELNHPQYASLTGVKQPLTLSEIQKRVLDDKVALIEYLVGEESTIAWVVRNNDLHYERLEVKRTVLDSLIRQWRQPFKDVKEGRIDNLADVPFDMKLSHDLYLHLFYPLQPYLKQGDLLVIAPDGILHYLPFESLIVSLEGQESDRKILFSEYEGAKFLVEQYAISYTPSASVLDPELKRSRVEADQNNKLIAFGNPDFGRDQNGEMKENQDDVLSLLIRDSGKWVFSPLPQSEEEIEEITRIIQPSQKFLNDKAKEEYFKQRAGDYEMVHLATHGILEEKQPLYSRIVFSQDADPTEDGFLQTYEVFNMDLKADLVVLSACETGLGALSAGEGLIGLTRAFMYAGTPSIIVSLWSVDESTCRLMKHLYQNLKEGMAKGEALQQAKIELIHTRDEGMSYAHPFLWAPFVLVGAWE